MANYDNQPARYGTSATGAVGAVDEGLRSYMLRVYNYMAIGLVLTGIAAYFTYSLSVTTDSAAAVAQLPGGVMPPELSVERCTSANGVSCGTSNSLPFSRTFTRLAGSTTWSMMVLSFAVAAAGSVPGARRT